jgi:hypothetical protein
VFRWRVLGASVAGFVHVAQGRGCDDAHGWWAGDAMTVIVIADGAGSRPGTSAVGSHLAVAAVLEASREASFAEAHASDPASAATALVEQAIAVLEAEAVTLELELRAFATTLCVAILAGEQATIAQVGDGVAAVEHVGGAIEVVAVAERFEYANEVVFLTAADALAHVKVFTSSEPVRSVALTTDGLRYKVLDDLAATSPYEPFFRESWDYARSEPASSGAIEDFLLEVDDQTGDDKTLLLAVTGFVGAAGDERRLTERPPLPASPPAAGDEAVAKTEDAPA